MYINYFSSLRTNLEPGQFDNELAYQKGRIVTKQVPPRLVIRTPEQDEAILNAHNKIYDLYLMCNRTAGLNQQILEEYINDAYHTFSIPKHSGGMREITAPNDFLKSTQFAILKTLYDLKVLPHNAAHGFTKKRNCKTALEVHKKHKSRWFLKLDIKDFFPSIDKGLLRKALKSYCNTHYLDTGSREMIITLCTRNGSLPQGAPTSPLLSNIVMIETDVKIQAICKELGLAYTRYADDILISGSRSFDWEAVQASVITVLQRGMQLKTTKTRYGSFNGRNWNLGLMFNNKWEITVGHANKKKIKNMIHRFNTMPAEKTLDNMLKINGLLGYYKFIEPEYFNDTPLVSLLEPIVLEPAPRIPTAQPQPEERPIQVGDFIRILQDSNNSRIPIGTVREVLGVQGAFANIYIVEYDTGYIGDGLARRIRQQDCERVTPDLAQVLADPVNVAMYNDTVRDALRDEELRAPVPVEDPNEIRIGDTVRILRDGDGHEMPVGTEVIVMRIDNRSLVTCDVINGRVRDRFISIENVVKIPARAREITHVTEHRAAIIGERIVIINDTYSHYVPIGRSAEVIGAHADAPYVMVMNNGDERAVPHVDYNVIIGDLNERL